MAYRVIDISSLAPDHLEEYIVKKSNNYMFSSFMRATEYANKLIYDYLEGHEDHADTIAFNRDEKASCDAAGQRFRQFRNPKLEGEERIIAIMVLYPYKVAIPDHIKRKSGRAKKPVSYEEAPDHIGSDEEECVEVRPPRVKAVPADVSLSDDMRMMGLDDPVPPMDDDDWNDL